MLINGRTRQACSALVEKLLAEHPGEIELRPMSKFPVRPRPVGQSPPAVPRLGKGTGLDSGRRLLRRRPRARGSREAARAGLSA